MSLIWYTGIGSNSNGIHTVEQFLALMSNASILYIENNLVPDSSLNLEFKDFNLPFDFHVFTLEDWMEYTGAEYLDN